MEGFSFSVRFMVRKQQCRSNALVYQQEVPLMTKTLSRLFASLLALAILCAALPMAALADGMTRSAVVLNPVVEERLHLRTSPSKNAESLGKYYNGVEVEILDYVNTSWAYVRIDTLTGYMQTKYLSTVLDSEQVDAMPRYISTSSAWELYSMPNRSSAYTTYGKNEIVRLLGFSEDWWHVEIERKEDDYLNVARTGFIPAVNSLQPTSGAYGAGYRTAVVKNPNEANRLNLRVSPTKDSTSLGRYYNGTTVVLLDDMPGSWWHVSIGGLEGYMDGSFLDTSANQYKVKDARPTLTIGDNNTIMYSGQSVNSIRMMSLSKGAQVTVLGFTADWCHILVGSQTGFIRNYSADGPQDTQYARPKPVWQDANAKLPTVEFPVDYGPDAKVAVVKNARSTDRLHLRTKPDKNAESIGRYYNGVKVLLLGETSGDFTKVSVCGFEGWMLTEFLETSTAPQDAPAPMMPRLVVDNPNPIGQLNLRAGQSTNTESIGYYPNGTEVIVLGFRSNWAHVYVVKDGKIGFMVAGYVQAEKD